MNVAAPTLAAIERDRMGVYNIVDDEPAPVAEWLPALAAAIGAKPPRRVPAWLARLFVGEHGVIMMTQSRGAANAKAKRDLGWRPAYPSWRTGFSRAPSCPGWRRELRGSRRRGRRTFVHSGMWALTLAA